MSLRIDQYRVAYPRWRVGARISLQDRMVSGGALGRGMAVSWDGDPFPLWVRAGIQLTHWLRKRDA